MLAGGGGERRAGRSCSRSTTPRRRARLRGVDRGRRSRRAEDYAGSSCAIDERGARDREVDGFLVDRQRRRRRAVIDAATGADGRRSLADDADRRGDPRRAPRPAPRRGRLGGGGRRSCSRGRRRARLARRRCVEPGATAGRRGVARPRTTAARARVAQRARPRARRGRRRASSPPSRAFEPELPERLARTTLAYLGLGDPRTDVGACSPRRAPQAPGIAAGFEDLVEQPATTRRGVDIERELLTALGGEAAFALERRRAGGEPRPAAPAVPVPEFVADEVDEERARRALAALQVPIAEALDPGRAAGAGLRRAARSAGSRRSSLRISPTVELTYAVFDGLARDRHRPGRRSSSCAGEAASTTRELYERATEASADEVSLLAYLDLGELVALGERSGLAEDPVYATFAGELPQPRGARARGRAPTTSCSRPTPGCCSAGERRRRRRDYAPARLASAPMNDKLGENEYLFTSESVTEGHPDKIADQISDGVLDAVLADDPNGRVACETLVNTGLVVVSGEISTETYVDIQDDRPRDDPQDRLHRRRPRLLGRLLRGDQRDRQAVARHRPGRRQGARVAHRPGRRRRARRRRRGRPGDDVRLRDPRDAGADAAADLARPQARPPARRGPQGRRRPLPAPRRQDPGHGPLRERPPDRDREGPDLDPAHATASTPTR